MAASAWLVLWIGHAERRARRSLYRSLGLAEATVDFLMERNRDVATELSYVRQDEATGGDVVFVEPAREADGGGARPNLRLVPPIAARGLLPGERPPTPESPTRH